MKSTDSDPLEAMINHLLGYPWQAPEPVEQNGLEELDPPDHWLSQDVKLRNNQRSVEGTIPAFMCQQVGINKRNPPRVTVYFDPYTELVIYDLAERFGEVDQNG